jgi:hypothetical protein
MILAVVLQSLGNAMFQAGGLSASRNGRETREGFAFKYLLLE